MSKSGPKVRTIFGVHPLKVVFALEYVMQGLANPFQGITYQSFFRHLRFDYGLTEAATQNLFAKSYLAWSFKPLLGFLIDAYGRTRAILIALLAAAALGFLLAPVVDTGPLVFFGFMFAVSIVLAATDVAVDRATVIAGDEEARASGRSKSTTVGLNQAICWTAVYGTSVVAAVSGGFVAENFTTDSLLVVLALAPLSLLAVAVLLPPDRAVPIPLRRSFTQFWSGLNSGPILGVILFYFVFHFQPSMGPLWTNYLIETLRFDQSDAGIIDGASYAGSFLGVLLFAWKGIHLQDRFGLRSVFRVYIVASILLALTHYMVLDPTFTRVARGLSVVLPFWDENAVRLVYLGAYSLLREIASSLIRMSTLSLVGAVIPVAAAGSLFAGFMSVANLAYSFAYSSGAWLYEHGMTFSPIRELQRALFSVGGAPGDELSFEMLVLLNAAAYALSFACVRQLPDRRETLVTADAEHAYPGPERWARLGRRLRVVNGLAVLLAVVAVSALVLAVGIEPISAGLLTFFGVTMIRKASLDALLRRDHART